MKVLKLISVLLDYPQAELIAAQQDMLTVIAQDDLLDTKQKHQLVTFVEQFCATPIMASQERYIELFDRGRAHSLLLFEHVHGESRDRGQAMVDLMALYERHGFELAARELPDYLPLFLEYLSTRPLDEVQDALGNVAHILAVIAERLVRRETSYASLFEALLFIAGQEVDRQAIREQIKDEKPDDTPAALDKVWEEEAVTFGGNAVSGGCPSTSHSGTPRDPSRTAGNINVRAL